MTRLAVIEKIKCVNGKGCNLLCAHVCPVNRQGKECVKEGLDKKAVIEEKLCIGCGICPKKCPGQCIQIINLPENLKKSPIHRHGETNGFELFSLPTPTFGKVTGIIGKNGIGKSTALKILAGLLKPNLGIPGKVAEYDDLIEYFKGTESQLFFEKLKQGQIKAAYKPQEVDLIPKQVSGKVIDILKRADEKGELEKITKELELDQILETDISKISGGELQRVAIAATVLKKANLYMFDEPTSFLDIKQRLKISDFIQKLANEETAVLVIEHDLIILDHMTELIHIMYGKEGAYGIVSLPKSARVGINIYLEGFLKEENIRFRDNHIKFYTRPQLLIKKEKHLTTWAAFKEKLGERFTLTSDAGELYKSETVGILGENGIGKTSFVKILAGEGKKEEALVNKISYKPQYLKKDEILVMLYLKEAISKYTAQLIVPLGLDSLFTKKLTELSGGELQRVMIAKCLSQEADVYLLDEPSAYLDVEQRLICSKIIKDHIMTNEKAGLVVDHDLLFIDYISEKIIVFEGTPAVEGKATQPLSMEDGMNKFLKDINLTFRRDMESNRPRANKIGSQKDVEQKQKGKLYYT